QLNLCGIRCHRHRIRRRPNYQVEVHRRCLIDIDLDVSPLFSLEASLSYCDRISARGQIRHRIDSLTCGDRLPFLSGCFVDHANTRAWNYRASRIENVSGERLRRLPPRDCCRESKPERQKHAHECDRYFSNYTLTQSLTHPI